jgi:CspA family cold shock protein
MTATVRHTAALPALPADPDASAHTLGGEHAEIACMPAANIVQRHKMGLAAQHFRALLAEVETFSAAAERAADDYAALSQSWPGAEAPVPPEAIGFSGLEVFEIGGAIKWFDASKGYGFIVPDHELPDVLLHVTCLRASGYQTAYEGARLVAQVLARPKGLQAFRILHMDESTAIHPSQQPPPSHVAVRPESDWEEATVKWFNRVRGFGYLTRGSGTPDIFVHMEIVRRFGFIELRPGQRVQVRWGMGSKGCMAAELRPDGMTGGTISSN